MNYKAGNSGSERGPPDSDSELRRPAATASMAELQRKSSPGDLTADATPEQ